MNSGLIDQYITVDDMRIRYWELGTGAPVLLIHGIGNSIETWEANLAPLAARHHVIALDIPGAGKSARSTRPEIYSLEYAGQFLQRFVSALGIPRISVVGHSMGGALALELTLKYPELVDKLVVADSAALGKEIHRALPLLATWPIGELLIHPTRYAVRIVAKEMVYCDEVITDEFVEILFEYTKTPGTKEALLRTMRGGVNSRGQSEVFQAPVLHKITQPVLVIWGKYDTLFPVKHAEAALRAIPNCRAVVLDRAAHAPQMDQPEIFNRLVLEFLENSRLSLENNIAPGRVIPL